MSISSIFKLLGNSFDFQKKTENKLDTPAFNNSVPTLDFSAQDDEAISFLTARSVNKDNPIKNPVLYKVYVGIPKDKEAVEYEQLEKAVIKAIFIKNGINPSRAAIEEVAERQKLDFTSKYDYQKKSYVFNDKNGLMINSKAISVNGKTYKGYELDITAETEKIILADAKLAREITLSGKKAFSELTMDERLKMLKERTGKYLPQDAAQALKEIDPRMLVAGAMTGAAASALVKKGVVSSNGLLLVGGAVGLAQLLKYGGDAQHIMNLVATAKSAEDLEKPAQELAELTKSGAVDALLTATGYGVGKAAPKISRIGGKAIELSAEYADEIGRISKQKWAEYDAKIKKLGDSLFPEPEFSGIPKQSSKIGETKGSNVFEMRGKGTGGNFKFEETMRQKYLPEGTVKVLAGDKLMQAAKITNRPAADQIAFVQKGKGLEAVITEITEGNKGLTHLKDQLRGGQMIAQSDKDYGIQTTNFVYRVVTNNEKLYRAIKADKAFQKEFKNPQVIFEGGRK